MSKNVKLLLKKSIKSVGKVGDVVAIGFVQAGDGPHAGASFGRGAACLSPAADGGKNAPGPYFCSLVTWMRRHRVRMPVRWRVGDRFP